MDIAFIKLHGKDKPYLLRADLIEYVEDSDAVMGNFDDWVKSVITLTEYNSRSTQFYCRETVEEIIDKLNNLNNDKIRVI